MGPHLKEIDFSERPIDHDVTVNDLYEQTKLPLLRFSLSSTPKKTSETTVPASLTEQVCVSNVNNQADNENGFLRSGFDYNFEHGEDTEKKAMEWAELMRKFNPGPRISVTLMTSDLNVTAPPVKQVALGPLASKAY